MCNKKFLIGFIGPLITILLIFLDVSISPYFSWYKNSLSSLGVHRYFFIFDSAVIIGGISIFIFALFLYKYLAVKMLSIAFIMTAESKIKKYLCMPRLLKEFLYHEK